MGHQLHREGIQFGDPKVIELNTNQFYALGVSTPNVASSYVYDSEDRIKQIFEPRGTNAFTYDQGHVVQIATPENVATNSMAGATYFQNGTITASRYLTACTKAGGFRLSLSFRTLQCPGHPHPALSP
jgi:hypothetical protein